MKTEAIERRSIEFRFEGDTIEGTLVRYGDTAKIVDFSETFKAGCFGDSIHNDLIVSLQHQRQSPVARTGAGLELKDSPLELRAIVNLSSSMQFSRECAAMVKGKILKGFSVEFQSVKDEWSDGLRIIHEAVLRGLAIVDRGAYAGSTIDEIRENCPIDRSQLIGKIFQPLWPYV